MQPHRIKLLERCVLLAKSFKTDRIRCFDYWRLDDQKPYRAVINAKLQRAAERCAKENLILLLENEMSCNTATGEESAAVLKIPDRNFMLNWDPGNAEAIGSTPYPGGYQLLPKQRIGHCHCNDVGASRMVNTNGLRWAAGPWIGLDNFKL